MKRHDEAYEGEWDFDGSCAPNEDGSTRNWNGQATFSLGCFQWVRRGKDSQGKGLKKGKVMWRVSGRTDAPAEAYRAAREYCAKQNARAAKVKT